MNERGISIIKVIIYLVAFSIFGYISTKWIIVRAHYQAIKDKVKEEARFAGTASNQVIRESIIERAKEVHVILYDEDISIFRYPGEDITINLTYPDSIFFPLHTFRFSFEIDETAPLPR
jgi:predicted membrane protein